MSTYAVREDGKKAFTNGTPMLHNPYEKYSDYWYQWNDGWKHAWHAWYQAVKGVWR